MNSNSKRALIVFTLCLAAVFLSSQWPADAKSRSSSSRSSSSRSSSYKSSSSSSKSSYSSSFSSSSASKSVWGKRSGGGIFGKETSSKSSGGYSKPGTKPKASASSSSGYAKPGAKKATAQSSAGYSKPKVAAAPSAVTGSRFDKKTVAAMKKKKAADSLAAYKKENSKFAKKVVLKPTGKYKSNPVYKKVKKYGGFDYRTQYKYRKDYYDSHDWEAPRYIYRSAPSFGMWDGLALWMILDSLNDRNVYAMAYHHAQDPGYQEWYNEARRLASDNEELKEKLDLLDNRIASMAGTPRNPAYLPSDMPPGVALAPDVIADKTAESPTLRLATASKTGNYTYFGNLLKDNATGLDVQIQTSAGSLDNIKMLMAGKVDAAIVQSDAFNVYKKKFPDSKTISSEQVVLYPEVIQMIANVKSGIKSVKDIKPGGKHLLYIGPRGSGTSLTWAGLVAQDPSYGRIETRNAAYRASLDQVEANPKAVMMFVAGLNSELLKEAERRAKETKKIRLVAVDDWDFNDARDENGNRIYQFVSIPKATYPGLQKGFILGRDVDSLSVSAILALRTGWVESYGSEAMDLLSFAVMETQPLIAQKTNGLK